MKAGGRRAAGIWATSCSAADRITAKARSPASRSSWLDLERNAGLEHRRVIGGLAAGEVEIGATEALEGSGGIGQAVLPGGLERGLEELETTPRHVGDELLAVAEMAVRRRRTDARGPRGLGKGEARTGPWRQSGRAPPG